MIAGLILAGGEGRRMGGLDKSLLVLAGRTLLHRIASTLRPQTDRLALGANGDPSRFAGSALPVLADETAGLGPLGGVLRGLDWAAEEGCEVLVTVACDTPFLPSDLVARLSPAPAVAVSGGRVHHTAAAWPVCCRDALRAHLRRGGERSVSGFSRTLGMREVGFADRSPDPFFNINRPEDLERAERMARASSAPARSAG